MSKIIVHFDKAGREIATSRLVPGAVEAKRLGLTGGEFDACVRHVRKGDVDALAALIGEREPLMSEAEAIDALAQKIAAPYEIDAQGNVVAVAVRFEVREAA